MTSSYKVDICNHDPLFELCTELFQQSSQNTALYSTKCSDCLVSSVDDKVEKNVSLLPFKKCGTFTDKENSLSQSKLGWVYEQVINVPHSLVNLSPTQKLRNLHLEKREQNSDSTSCAGTDCISTYLLLLFFVPKRGITYLTEVLF